MTQYGLFPSFGKLNYHSDFGNHTMTIPFLQWASTPNVNGAGSLPQWDTGTVDVHTMMLAYVDLLADLMPTTITFDDYIVYNYESEDAVPDPVAGKVLGIAGTLVGNSVRASSVTFNMRTTGFNPFKVVLLDTIPEADFIDTLPGDFSAAHLALVGFLTGNDHGIAGRDGNQPYQAISITYNINDRLKRRS